jgi:hypothetical protein
VPVTGIEKRYARRWGGGQTARHVKGNIICWSNGYEVIRKDMIEAFECKDASFSDCAPGSSKKISGRERGGDGSLTLYWKNGKT